MNDMLVRPRGHCQEHKHLRADTLFDTLCGVMAPPFNIWEIVQQKQNNPRCLLVSGCGGGIE